MNAIPDDVSYVEPQRPEDLITVCIIKFEEKQFVMQKNNFTTRKWYKGEARLKKRHNSVLRHLTHEISLWSNIHRVPVPGHARRPVCVTFMVFGCQHHVPGGKEEYTING